MATTPFTNYLLPVSSLFGPDTYSSGTNPFDTRNVFAYTNPYMGHDPTMSAQPTDTSSGSGLGLSSIPGVDPTISALRKSLGFDGGNKQDSSGTSTPTSTDGTVHYSSELGQGDGGVYQWRDQINKASQLTGTPAQVIAAIMQVESGGNNPSGANVAGAVGLMQVLPKYHASRAEKYGYNVSDPQGNIVAGADYLKENFDKAKNTYAGITDAKAWDIAAAQYLGAWNWSAGTYSGAADDFGTTGPAYVQRFDTALSQFGGVPTTSSTITPTNSSSDANISPTKSSAIDTAQQFLGESYVWGGANPNQGFDCSGLVQYSYGKAGVNLPRTAQQQYNATQRVDSSQAQKGDLIFFTQTYDAGEPVSHVGIYLGNGMMLDSQSNGIMVESINSPYWQQHFYGFGRVT